ncbi:hypothetical protein [Streptomyces sp. NPDC047042]|uniref:hypothetical protein n=1 Tax=Streptomyces sp. NPDC047042 TaxID=3154807 RepID=UPI0033DE6F40
MLIVGLSDPVKNLLLHTLGATVAGDRLFCSERHDSTYRPQPSEDVEPLQATCSPEKLGRIAAAWFEEIVRRPIVAPPGPRGILRRPRRCSGHRSPLGPQRPRHCLTL